MKKPRSYLKAVAAANPGLVTPVNMRGKAYLASLPPLAAAPVMVVSPATVPVASTRTAADLVPAQ